ncbi:MAG: hypothetical protein ACJAXX_001209 [Roseivirga sp.]|jgi:hypothetical protein
MVTYRISRYAICPVSIYGLITSVSKMVRPALSPYQLQTKSVRAVYSQPYINESSVSGHLNTPHNAHPFLQTQRWRGRCVLV